MCQQKEDCSGWYESARSRKKVEVTNAALKGNGKDADVMEDASSQSVEKGNTK